jgi:hypothetical protein
VRFELLGPPIWTNICHCNACKKRTGSAYGFSLVVDASLVKSFSGDTKTFKRRGESGKEVRYEFCPDCGTTVRWHVDLIPTRQVFAGGTLDDPRQFEVAGEMYTDQALSWSRIGCELAQPGAPDDTFRNAAIAKSRASHSWA